MIDASELLIMAPALDDPAAKAEQLSRLANRILEQGSLRGVTALKTEESIKNELILDSLGGLASLPRSGAVIDIGTGGGVPGLVLAVARPDLSFTLTDSAVRKTTWVKECVAELGLSNVIVHTARLENLGREVGFRESFSAVTAKALASLPVLIELSMPLLRVGGRLIAYKGPALEQEIHDARKALKLLAAEVERTREYVLNGKTYRVAEIVKRAPTANRYPRRDGVPQKTPL
jgi:16S rRNA (guanine527-N7)-methyltransferase